jgi:chloramphenicol 3-O phosphotransferase
LRPGQIVILNGAPRAGKSNIVEVIQETFDGPWMNLGVDAARQITPPRYQPGIGLRPGEPDHDAAAFVPTFYAAWYESIAAHSRAGLNVVVDVGHHDEGVLGDCARRLEGLPVLVVGVRCPIEVIMERRNAGQPGREGGYATGSPEDPIPAPVRLWQRRVHDPGIYDLEVDTFTAEPATQEALLVTSSRSTSRSTKQAGRTMQRRRQNLARAWFAVAFDHRRLRARTLAAP